jgi:hypothetical protein
MLNTVQFVSEENMFASRSQVIHNLRAEEGREKRGEGSVRNRIRQRRIMGVQVSLSDLKPSWHLVQKNDKKML